MAKIDVSDLSRDELVKLQGEIDIALKDYDKRRKQDALAAAEAKAKELGFSLKELLGGTSGKGSARAKYQHPGNPDLTWTGRGRKPRWFLDALEQGVTIDELSI